MDDLISRQAAIEYFMTNTNWHDEDGYEIHDADDKRALLKSYFDGIPSAQPEQRWIPVSERLPEHNGRYLVTNTAWGKYTVDWNLWMDGEWLYPGNPIAWMPGPEAYQEDKK